jgi:AcrR family transcriptional regulator
VRVSEVQRTRILAAMARVVAEESAGSVTVARIVARAGVSRRTFYDLFSDCEDCFLAVFEDAVTRASTIANEAAAGAPPAWRKQIRAGLGALLIHLDEYPAVGSLLVVDALGAGPRVLERRTHVLATLATIVDQGRAEAKRGRGKSSSSSPPPLTAEGTVGAVLGVIHARMLEPDHRRRRPLVELLNPLMGMIVLPYLGQAAAAGELARPTPTRPRRSRPGSAGASTASHGARTSDPLEGLNMRLTYRTLMVLSAIATNPGTSNRHVAEHAGIHDQGQISKLLGRLTKLGLIHNTGQGQPNGEPNAWTLTHKGTEIQQALATGR